ncbi:hypothetical protein Gbth_024_109 [Gluconobacter thailandicus F149-1 = NBRC 100600]|nr:hypothetical protein Gbth_024_109 [Gluconobacter thailandicus F149-1 = NBRC 100600]GEL85770.1 hypothetical protein GTH01_01280 [Gluconobacter thailandicus F149-1 = NBRC 100600]
MGSDTFSRSAEAGFGLIFDINDQMAIALCQSDEVAFRIDHDLLDECCSLFQQAAQKMGFARAGIALNQQARSQQFRQINAGV